ncbi:radical SAM protein [Candidatus Pacearchaeota archaeon]|nr:radical SAM protein [Candidatus Pacearchaeota archaeon]
MLRLIRNILSDKSDDFTYHRFNRINNIGLKPGSGLYIHIPFCKNSCPYCPYIKTFYNKDLAREYKNALLKEISLYYDYFGKKNFTSLYFGGGTPTLMINEMSEILEHLHKYFNIEGDIALETSPDEINKEVLTKLKHLGFNLISIGIQSFNNSCLKKIGRNYDMNTAVKALGEVNSVGFDSVNIDLIFAIENQTIEDIRNDLSVAISHNINQITCYPLFTFPFSEIGKIKQLKKIKLPNHLQRRKMYYFINKFLYENGYSRTNVWSFIKNHKNNYSSVTRDYYLGLGASSGSYNGEIFYFNTFYVSEYIKSVNSRLPVSIAMNVSKKLEKNFWLYWQLYITIINKKSYKEMFRSDIKKDFGFILKLIKIMGFIEYEDENIIKLNTKGSHWIHLIQNYYALEYVNKIWSVSKNNPWPDRIKL